MSDQFLKTLNAMANEKKITFGLTLVVAGGVIAGTVISAKTYVEEFANSFSDAWPGGQNEDVRAGLAVWGEPGSESIHEDFIHLKDARYVFGQELVPNGLDGLLWRGSLDSISGYSLGALMES